MKDTSGGGWPGGSRTAAVAVALPICSRAAGPLTLVGLGATAPAHLRTHRWCRRASGPADRRGSRVADATLVGAPGAASAAGTPAYAACMRPQPRLLRRTPIGFGLRGVRYGTP